VNHTSRDSRTALLVLALGGATVMAGCACWPDASAAACMTTPVAYTSLPIASANFGIEDPMTHAIPAAFSRINLTLNPTFPDRATLDATRVYVVGARARTTGDACGSIWNTQVPTVLEGGTLVLPNMPSMAVSPVVVGEIVVFVYAFSAAVDTFCQTDEWCTRSALGRTCVPIASGLRICAADAASAPRPTVGWCGTATVTASTTVDLPTFMRMP
jgi:hypothetical protein